MFNLIMCLPLLIYTCSSRPYRRMKLMLVGGTNIGKTSLLINLVKKGKMKRFTEVAKGVNDLPLSTVGVELGDWEYSQGGKPKVTFMTWDFGGQVRQFTKFLFNQFIPVWYLFHGGVYSRGDYSRGDYSRGDYSRGVYSRGDYSREVFVPEKYQLICLSLIAPLLPLFTLTPST